MTKHIHIHLTKKTKDSSITVPTNSGTYTISSPNPKYNSLMGQIIRLRQSKISERSKEDWLKIIKLSEEAIRESSSFGTNTPGAKNVLRELNSFIREAKFMLPKATKDAKTPQVILAEIKRQRRLEDRSEYGIEDLMQMYGLNKEDAKVLENLIKQAMNGPGTKDSSKPNIHGLFQKQALERGAKGSGIFLYEQAGSHTAYYTKASAQKNVNEFNNEPIFVGPDKGKLPKDVYNEFQKAKFFEYTPAECKAELEKMNG